MKEIIVIDSKDLKCAEDKNYVIARKEKCKVEKYPTNWEELKELCKDLKGVVTTNNGNGIYFRCLFFWKEGIIEDENQNLLSEATPERQYRIIKSLIGEE